jgi:vancomycin resistance protein VanJ
MTVRFSWVLLKSSIILSWLYMTLLILWLAAYLTIGDRLRFLGLVNLLAVYLFFPLPLLLLAAIITKRPGLWIGFTTGVFIFISLWGLQFNPLRLTGSGQANSTPSLRLMTYNVLAWHDHSQPLLRTILYEKPDILFIQELNPNLARALQSDLFDIYPYQILDPLDNPRGIGTISRYPIRETGIQLADGWIGGPQVLILEWEGMEITIINVHMTSTTGINSRAHIEKTFAQRESQARTLVDFASQSGPIIVSGDANSAPQNDSYRILTSELVDAWREAGFGLGHTFPGSAIPGSDRPQFGNWYVPRWLSRIDYVFYSNHFKAIEARTAAIDGVSDHRGVTAILVVR